MLTLKLFNNFNKYHHYSLASLFFYYNKQNNLIKLCRNFHFNRCIDHNLMKSSLMLNNSSSLIINNISKRTLAKGKDRIREKNRTDKPKVILNDEEMLQVIEIDELRQEIDRLINEFKEDLKLNYNLKLNPRVIENLEISCDGTKLLLADIVNIVRKQNDLIINLSSTPNLIKSVIKTINELNLNLTIQQDGNIVYIKMPKVTTEYRQTLIKSINLSGMKLKTMIKDRNFHKKYMKNKDLKRISKDLLNDVQSNLLYYIKQKCNDIDVIIKKKEESLLN